MKILSTSHPSKYKAMMKTKVPRFKLKQTRKTVYKSLSLLTYLPLTFQVLWIIFSAPLLWNVVSIRTIQACTPFGLLTLLYHPHRLLRFPRGNVHKHQQHHWKQRNRKPESSISSYHYTDIIFTVMYNFTALISTSIKWCSKGKLLITLWNGSSRPTSNRLALFFFSQVLWKL